MGMMCGGSGRYSRGKIYQRHTFLACAHNTDMKKKRNTENPIDEMIQGNKDEAESMLRVWGKKKRTHPLPNNARPK